MITKTMVDFLFTRFITFFAKTRRFIVRKVIIMMIVALLAVSFALVACGQKKDEPKDDGKTIEQPERKDAIEEKIEEPDMKEVAFAEYKSFGSELLYRIELVEFADKYVFATLPTEAEAGNIFVKVTVGVKNETQKTVKVLSLLFDAKIYDPKGKEYASETFTDDALEGDVEPETEKSGVFFFKIPGDNQQDLTGWVLKMKTDDILSHRFVELPLN